VVGVLVLVDQDVAEAPPVVLGDVGEGLQQVDRRHDQVVEVQRVGLAQPCLVGRVDLRQLLLHPRLGLGAVGLPVDQLVLQVAHLVAHRAGREALGVQVEVAADQRHQPLGVGRVVDREGAGEAQLLGLGAQDPDARGVERQHPHRPGAGTDDGGHPLAHLAGGLVGEGDRQDLAGLHVAGREQVGDAGGERLGLAGAGAGDDEQRAALMDHRLALLRVEPLEQPVHRRPGRSQHGRPGVDPEQGVVGVQAHPHQSRSGPRRSAHAEDLVSPCRGGSCRRRGGVVVDTQEEHVTEQDETVERALVVTAHPDDVDFGAGGTVAAWTAQGIEVSYCICTDGDAGGFDPEVPRSEIAGIRQAEQRPRRRSWASRTSSSSATRTGGCSSRSSCAATSVG
jgi:hypothetical protein